MGNGQDRIVRDKIRLHSLTTRSNKCELLAAVLLLLRLTVAQRPWPDASPRASWSTLAAPGMCATRRDNVGNRAWIIKGGDYTRAEERFAQTWVKTWKLVLRAQNSGSVVIRGYAGFNRERISFQICTLLPHLRSKSLSPFTTTPDSHLLTLSYICCKEGINFAAICTWFEPPQSVW